MPSRRLSLASGHSGSHSCSKRPSGRLVGLIGRLSHTSVRGQCSFLGVFIIGHEAKSDISGVSGGSPEQNLPRASKASSFGRCAQVAPKALKGSSLPGAGLNPPMASTGVPGAAAAPATRLPWLRKRAHSPETLFHGSKFSETDIHLLVAQRGSAGTV